MCKAFEDHYESGRKFGFNQGISQERETLLLALIKDKEITIESAARRMDMTPEEFAVKYSSKL